MLPRSGEVLVVNREASVQFAKPILFRVIRVIPRDTYDGWVWLDGYELGENGDAVERREIFVQPCGLRPAIPTQPAVPRSRPRPRPTNIVRVGSSQNGDVFARRIAPGGARVAQRNR